MADNKINKLSEEDLVLLRSIPLQDVMQKNGHTPARRREDEYWYNCPMPGHNDSDASFCVELYPKCAANTEGVAYARYNCLGQHDIHGKNAMELQADLMGVSLTDRDGLMAVVRRLVADHGVKVQGVKIQSAKWETVAPVDELKWTTCEWTDEHLKALGCKVSPRFEMNYYGENENTGEKVYSWAYVGDVNHETQRAVDFDPKELERVFGVYPVKEFVMPAKMRGRRNATGGANMTDSGASQTMLNATGVENRTTVGANMTDSRESQASDVSYKATMYADSPVFVFKSVDRNGHWRVKKYDPYARVDNNGNSYKWTWWYEGGKNRDRDFANTLYGDVDVMDSLMNIDVLPQDTSTHKNHPVVVKESTNEKGEKVDVPKFKRVVICSGPRDAMQVYYHSDAHVVYPHSESSVIDRRLILRLMKISAQVYILYDADVTGRRKATELNLEYIEMSNIELPAELGKLAAKRDGKPCKDVSDLFDRYTEMTRNNNKNVRKTVNEKFEAMLTDAIPLKFWKRKYSKATDKSTGGDSKYKYTFVTDSIKRFCEANGFVTVDDDGVTRFARVENNIVRFIPEKRIVSEVHDCMKQWLHDHPYHNDVDLRTQIDMSRQTITVNILQDIKRVEIKKAPSKETVDYMFFNNGVLVVTPVSADMVEYENVPFYVNADKIKPYDYIQMPRTFHIEKNMDVEKLEVLMNEELDSKDPDDRVGRDMVRRRWQERMELNAYKLVWDIPLEEQPECVQYLYDTCRCYWQEEEDLKRQGKELDSDKRQVQDMHFISKMAGIGFLLSSYRNPRRTNSMAMILYLLDGNNSDNERASGRTGKSILSYLIDTVRCMHKIDGKSFKTSNEEVAKNFAGLDYRLHDFINVNDLYKGAKAEMFNNMAEGEYRVKSMFKDEVNIPFEFAPKMLISMNKMFDMSEDSTRDRYWVMNFFNYYHTSGNEFASKFSPRIKFGHDIPDYDNETELQHTMNFMVQCLQFWQSELRYIKAPRSEDDAHRELMAQKGMNNDFVAWADAVFQNEWMFGYPIPKRDLVVSYLQFTNKSGGVTMNMVSQYLTNPRFNDNLTAYCKRMNIIPNPRIVVKRNSDSKRNVNNGGARCDAWAYEFDERGNLISNRIYKNKITCFYFYHNGFEPTTIGDVISKQDKSVDKARDGYVAV